MKKRASRGAGAMAVLIVAASTFKIFNSLLALETGVIGVDDVTYRHEVRDR